MCGESLNDVYGQVPKRQKNAVEGKSLRVNVYKTIGMQISLGRKVVFQRWILVVSVVNGLVVILFSVRSVSGGFIIIVLMWLGI